MYAHVCTYVRTCAHTNGGLKTDSKTKQKKTQKLPIITLLLVYRTLSIPNGVLGKIWELEAADFLIYYFSEAIAKNGIVISSNCSHNQSMYHF